MKKILTLTLAFIFIFSVFSNKVNAQPTTDNSVELAIDAPSAILIEYSTGKILYQKDADKKMYPASMTKMMAIYLFLEQISNNNHSFSDVVTVSALASSMGGSQIFLKENEQMTFDDLFKAVTIASANDATVALAEYTYGSLSAFIDEMNSRAKQFGMNSTNFVNVTGFHDPNHYTSASDMSIIARKLLKEYQDILLPYTSTYDTYLRQDTSSPFWLVNTNRMLKSYPGMDGLKTGYTSDSGFNLTATAIRNNLRLISVVMGGETSKSRNKDTSTLLDYGFNNYKSLTIYQKGETLTKVDFNNAKTSQDEIISKEDITIVVRKNTKLEDLIVKIEITDIDSPKSENDIVGYIQIKNSNDEELARYNLYPNRTIEKLSFWDLVVQYLKELI